MAVDGPWNTPGCKKQPEAVTSKDETPEGIDAALAGLDDYIGKDWSDILCWGKTLAVEVRRLRAGGLLPTGFCSKHQLSEYAIDCRVCYPEGAPETGGDLSRDNVHLRILLANAYGGTNLYRDDGELQDGSCIPVIDFARDPVSVIENKMQERGLRKLRAAEKSGADPFSDLPREDA